MVNKNAKPQLKLMNIFTGMQCLLTAEEMIVYHTLDASYHRLTEWTTVGTVSGFQRDVVEINSKKEMHSPVWIITDRMVYFRTQSPIN